MRAGCCHTSKNDAFSLFLRLDHCLLVRLHTGMWHFLNQLNIKVSIASRSGYLAITTEKKNQKKIENEYLRLDFPPPENPEKSCGLG